jgi:2-keto-4-pentenoate hydratase
MLPSGSVIHRADVPNCAIMVELLRDGEPAGSSGSGPDVVDDPYLSLARVAVLLYRYGRALEPGQRILTGSILPGAKTEGAKRYEASFGPLGGVAVEFE